MPRLRQETDCSGASAADTFDFQQVPDGVHVQVGETHLLFVDPETKISGAYCQTRFHDDDELKQRMFDFWRGLERPLTWFSRSRHSLTLNISQTATDTAIVTIEGE